MTDTVAYRYDCADIGQFDLALVIGDLLLDDVTNFFGA